MSLNLYDTTIVQIKSMLKNLVVWLEKAEQHADSKSIPHTEFTEARLAPDMLPLTNQIYILCNTAKFTVVRVVGHADKSWEDNQKTFAELRERIAGTIEYLDGVKREEFDAPDIATKKISTPSLTFDGGVNYINQFAVPNFYFHLVTTYDLLRHKGLEIGKRDFLTASWPKQS